MNVLWDWLVHPQRPEQTQLTLLRMKPAFKDHEVRRRSQRALALTLRWNVLAVTLLPGIEF